MQNSQTRFGLTEDITGKKINVQVNEYKFAPFVKYPEMTWVEEISTTYTVEMEVTRDMLNTDCMYRYYYVDLSRLYKKLAPKSMHYGITIL